MTFNENASSQSINEANKKEENQINIVEETSSNSRNDFMNKLKMFENKAKDGSFEVNQQDNTKKVEDKKETSDKKEQDKSKEQRMSKALQRIKKKRGKDSEKSESANPNNNDVHKSIRIQNMANMLENQMSHQMPNEGNDINVSNAQSNNEINTIKKDDNEDDAFDRMVSMLKEQSGKVVIKKKKSKKKFEE